MTWQETKSKTLEVHAMVINSLKKRYSFEEVADGVQFQNTKGIPFIVYAMGTADPWNFLTIEYEDTGEDGDAYYPEDYDNFDDMLCGR